MSMPREPYRVAYGTPTARSTHTIRGLEGVVRDTRSMTALVEMIRARCKANARQEDIAADKLANVGLRYAVDETLVGARSLMCNWTFETVGLTHVGLSEELSVDGMLKASFADGRLERVALSFDCMAFMQQLNARGLLDMGAIAKAAAAASRGGLATSAAAAAPPPRPPVVVPAGLLGNATAVVSGHAGDLANRLPTTAQTDANQWIRNVVAAAAPATAVGAGDTLLGVTAAAYLRIFDLQPDSLPNAIVLGMRAAELTVNSDKTVHPAISSSWLEDTALATGGADILNPPRHPPSS
mmetsp:Transcript_17673/g.53890  ORF Transcript_17673/g.53890 Transcript_17673/m.53890 type:complete len:297 (-) Transcript_17673:1052-1942(-)